MKRLMFITILCAFMAGPTMADIYPFSDTIDFSADGSATFDGTTHDYTAVDCPDDTPFSYTHNLVGLDPPAEAFLDATLYVTHAKNLAGSNSYELWFIADSASQKIGDLSKSQNPNKWVNDQFDVTNLITGSGANWSLQIMVDEEQWNPTISPNGLTMFLAESTVAGNYVPVPAAVVLGILGLGVAGWKLRKFA